jgi:predicted nucleotidyltransferase
MATRTSDAALEADRGYVPLYCLPKSGTILPEMRRATSPSGLADALFTPVQRRVLGLLFGQPDRHFQSAELIRLVEGGVGAVHRQLVRLEQAGLVEVTRIGNQKHYQARRASPIFAELQGLVAKTVGMVEPLRNSLGEKADGIRAAFVFGSIAKGSDRAGSDIDLMVISDTLRYADLFEALQTAETRLARPINPTVMSVADWRAKRAQVDSFAGRLAAQPKLFVIGSDDDLA